MGRRAVEGSNHPTTDMLEVVEAGAAWQSGATRAVDKHVQSGNARFPGRIQSGDIEKPLREDDPSGYHLSAGRLTWRRPSRAGTTSSFAVPGPSSTSVSCLPIRRSRRVRIQDGTGETKLLVEEGEGSDVAPGGRGTWREAGCLSSETPCGTAERLY